ncbi:MAG: response regulator [Candidatus Latescibacteria bacterium]|nr:response regulator [Candidatus Latescibacterota bacterium]
MSNTTALIVDDEPLARRLVAEYLADFPRIDIVGEAANGPEAVRTISSLRPDLVFLDVQMPGLNGFEVLARLEEIPAVIFSTAHDEYALKAFEVNAVDYLLKPYDRARFAQAVERAMARQPADSENLLGLLPAEQAAAHLFVRAGGRIIRIATAAILWIEAAGDYAQLHTAGRSHLCGLGLGALEKRLDPGRFIRVHRSAIIALEALDFLDSDGEGGLVATLTNGAQVKVSRSQAARLRDLLV